MSVICQAACASSTMPLASGAAGWPRRRRARPWRCRRSTGRCRAGRDRAATGRRRRARWPAPALRPAAASAGRRPGGSARRAACGPTASSSRTAGTFSDSCSAWRTRHVALVGHVEIARTVAGEIGRAVLDHRLLRDQPFLEGEAVDERLQRRARRAQRARSCRSSPSGWRRNSRPSRPRRGFRRSRRRPAPWRRRRCGPSFGARPRAPPPRDLPARSS